MVGKLLQLPAGWQYNQVGSCEEKLGLSSGALKLLLLWLWQNVLAVSVECYYRCGSQTAACNLQSNPSYAVLPFPMMLVSRLDSRVV
jgi:hypothetical protein